MDSIPDGFFPSAGAVPKKEQHTADALVCAHRKAGRRQSEFQYPDADYRTHDPYAPHRSGDDDKRPFGIASATQRTGQHGGQHLRHLDDGVILQANSAQRNYRQIRRKHPQNRLRENIQEDAHDQHDQSADLAGAFHIFFRQIRPLRPQRLAYQGRRRGSERKSWHKAHGLCRQIQGVGCHGNRPQGGDGTGGDNPRRGHGNTLKCRRQADPKHRLQQRPVRQVLSFDTQPHGAFLQENHAQHDQRADGGGTRSRHSSAGNAPPGAGHGKFHAKHRQFSGRVDQ